MKLLRIPFILAVLASPCAAQTITYAEHIASIVYNNCTVCHREGEIGPMPLTNYQEVAAFAESIRYVTSEKLMPPWPPDRSFSRFVGERALTDDQLKMINDWVDGGSLRGDPDKEPPLPDFPEGSVLGKPDLVLTVEDSYRIRGNGKDEYRVFVLPTGLSEDKDVVAVEFRPGNPEIVHHAVMTYDTTGEARRLDAEDRAAGYPSFGGFGVPAREGLAYPGWVPGATPQFFPAGTGLKLPAGADLLVQVHYAPWPTRASDQSTVNLFFAEEPVERYVQTRVLLPSDLVNEDGDHYTLTPLEGAIGGALIGAGVQEFLGETATSAEIRSLARNATLDTVFGNQVGGTVAGFLAFDIPANTSQDFRAVWNIKEDISLLNVWPHMHYLGKNWEIVLEKPDGSSENLVRINDWNFNWQGTYTFPTYIHAPAGSKIYASARYDNTEENVYNPSFPPKDVNWGEKTTDEMYFLPFSYVEYQDGDENISLESFGPGDFPEFRISDVTDQEVQFRLRNSGQSYFIEFSLDMKLWQRATVANAESEGDDWTNLTVPRGEDSAGFYRAVLFSDQ